MDNIAPGAVIASRYRLEIRLDEGGRAQVWRAADPELERAVAIKLLQPGTGEGPETVEQFRAEAQIEASLKHPNIVEVYDEGRDGDTVYSVMQLIDGVPVSRVLASQGRQRWQAALAVGRQASAALAYAHQQGAAHGTLTDERIMTGPGGHATVLAFGVRCREGGCETPPSPDADTYALGGVMYEMLTGISPFAPPPAEHPAHLPWPRPVHQIAHDCPHELSRIVMKAIDPDPSRRYASAAELHADLDAFARPKSRAWLWLALAALVVILVGLLTWYVSTVQRVVVPYVIGQSTADATAVMRAAGLTLVVSSRQASANVPTDTVVSENPSAGERVRSGAQVAVVISSGLPQVAVPSVVGTTLESASSAIGAAGLKVGTVTRQNSSAIPADAVISASPSPGTTVSQGSSVDLVVSAGQATVAVPDVRGASSSAAQTKLTEAVLVPQVGQVYSSSVPAGTVVSQGPAPGTVVPVGSTVTISVSEGPAPVVVPDVVGAQVSDAKTALTDLGLVPIVSLDASGSAAGAGKPKGTVHTQSPEGGDSVPAGSKVTLSVYN